MLVDENKHTAVTQNRQSNRFRLLTETELADLPKAHWLIDELVPAGGCAILFGQPGSAKSFLALDWALSVASGLRWNGRDVKQGLSVYVAAEGHSGLDNRVRAWKKNSAVESAAAIRFVVHPVQLHDKDDVQALLAELRTLPASPRLVIIDTLARCAVDADENSQKDMGLAIQGLDRIRAATGATVLLVHHSGKARKSTSLRGSSVLDGAADVIICCAKSGSAVTINCTKQKDAEASRPICLKLARVDFAGGHSCALMDASSPSAPTSNEDRALAALQKLVRARSTVWQKASGLTPGTFGRAKDRLIEQEDVEQVGRYFQLVPLGVPSASGQDFQPSTHPVGVGGGGNGETFRKVH